MNTNEITKLCKAAVVAIAVLFAPLALDLLMRPGEPLAQGVGRARLLVRPSALPVPLVLQGPVFGPQAVNGGPAPQAGAPAHRPPDDPPPDAEATTPPSRSASTSPSARSAWTDCTSRRTAPGSRSQRYTP